MENQLTRRRIQELLRSHTHEIMKQLGDEEIIIGISMSDSKACLSVSVLSERVSEIPHSITIMTDEGEVEIPVKAKGDYEPIRLH